jgi:hypothetical protein
LHDFAAWRLACAAPNRLATHRNRLALFSWLGRKIWHGHALNALLGKALNRFKETFFIQADQADRLARTTSTACTANAVNVVLGHIGDFVIDHMRQIVNVDATRGDICRHQCADRARFKALQRLRSSRLALVAMQCQRFDAVLG